MDVSIRDLQKKALEILDYFDKFCIEYNLEYFVCGGCCIGSQRHQGFIPWDDDIDVFMPRPDYEKLSAIWGRYGDHEKYTLCRTNKELNYHDCGTLLKDNNTTFINSHSTEADIHHGYMLDIIPLDGYAPTKPRRMAQIFYASLFSLYNAQRLPDNQGALVKSLSALLLGIVPSKSLRYAIWKFSEKRMSKYDFYEAENITELVTGFRYMKNKYPKEIFSQQLWVDFEERKIPIPLGYDQYLTMAFGDYMELPPKEKRMPKHDAVFIDLNNSYKKYKGVWYCRNER